MKRFLKCLVSAAMLLSPFAAHSTEKFEYDYLGLGNRTFVVPAGAPFFAGDTFTTNNRNVQMVKVGVNYLFNWGAPVAARY